MENPAHSPKATCCLYQAFTPPPPKTKEALPSIREKYFSTFISPSHPTPIFHLPSTPIYPFNMSSSKSSTPDCTPQPRMVVHNLYIPDPSADEIDLTSEPWMAATIIDDDDLMFGGKPLCAWYEEDRRMLSCSTVDEETRGRQRERTRADSHHQKPHHQQRHEHQHHHHHDKKASEMKE